MKTVLIGILAAAGFGLSTTAAQAGGVHWSIGVNLPPVSTVISSGPAYGPAPVYAAPPVYYAPPPVVYAPPVYVRPAPRYYVPAPAPVVVYRGWGGRGYHGGHPGGYRSGYRDGYVDGRRGGWR